jgi:hypothetical protein
MGDAADLSIEQGMAEEEYRYEHPDEFEDENCDCSPSKPHYSYKPKYKVCRCCGVGKLHWGTTLNLGGKWRLFDINDKLHQCKVKPLAKRHVFPEKVKSGNWFQIDPYMGAASGQRNYIKNGAVKWDVCLSKTLKVGDTIPTGMVLEEELK